MAREMTTLTKLIPVVFAFGLCLGCENDVIPVKIDPATKISFQVEKSNTNSDYVSTAVNNTDKRRSSQWWQDSDGAIRLERKITFDVTLENGQNLEFGLSLVKTEPRKDLLILMDENLNYWERNWDYTSFENKKTNFYYEFDYAYVAINSNVTFHDRGDSSFRIIRVEKAIVNGVEKSYVTIKFKGEAFGWYDPYGEFTEVFNLTNGVFKGIIE